MHRLSSYVNGHFLHLMVSDYETAESRGFAFVRFYDVRDAEDAMLALNGRKFDGRPLRIQFARYGRPGSPEERY